MALNFEDIPIPLTEGQDGSKDHALIQLPKMLRVQNGEFDDRGNIRVSDGHTVVPITSMASETPPDDTNPALRRLLTHKDELLLETYKGTYRQQVGGSFALAAGSQNKKRNSLRTVRAGVQSLVEAQSSSQDDYTGTSTQPAAYTGLVGTDAASLGDYVCVVWAESFFTSAGTERSQICWQIRHKTSDALVGRGRVRSTVGNESVREPRVVVFGGAFQLFGIDLGVAAGSVGRLAIDPASTQAVNETLANFVDIAVTALDVALSPTQFCITTGNSGAGGISHWVYNQATPTALVGGGGVVTGSTVNQVSNAYISDSNNFVGFGVAAATTTTLRWVRVSSAGVLSVQGTQVFAQDILRVFVFKVFGGNQIKWPVLVETYGLAPQNYDTQGVTYDWTSGAPGALAGAATLTIIVREHQVFSQPVFVSEPVTPYTGFEQQGLYLGVVYASDKQNTYQVIDIARSVTSMLGSASSASEFSVLRVFDCGACWPLLALGGAVTGRACQPVAVVGESLAWHFWCAKFTPNITNAVDLGQNPTHIQRNTLRLLEPLGSIEFADLTYMAGGTPLVYDGQDVFEEGFTFAPEIISVTVGAGVTPLSVGSYSIVVVYEWFDGQGNRWQSAPSAPTAFTTTPGNQTYTVSVRALRTTLRSGVRVVPYRTTLASPIYRRDSPLGEPPLTDAAMASTTAPSELLYTGGVVGQLGTQSNNALPGVKNFTVHQNRLVAVGGEFSRGFFYSKERDDDFPAEFNRASGFGTVPEVTGRVAAASSFDDKLLLFAENGLSVIFGQGPNFAWAQNGYTTPVRIQAAEGIRFDTPWLGEVDDGVWYVTSTGPRLLSRGLATAKGPDGLPLGEEARTAAGTQLGACYSIVTHPTRAQVWFLAADSTRHIYDYQRNKWTTNSFGSNPNIGVVAARGVLNYISSVTIASNPLSFQDSASTEIIGLTLETGWLNFAGIMRFQRFTHLGVLCAQGSKASRANTFLVASAVYTIDDPTGTPSSPFIASVAAPNAANAPWRCEIQMVRQTADGYKLTILVQPVSGQPGGNFSITGLLARVGLKKGGPKLPASNRG